VKDTSLRVPTSVKGTVIDVQVFTRERCGKGPAREGHARRPSSRRSARTSTTSTASSKPRLTSGSARHSSARRPLQARPTWARAALVTAGVPRRAGEETTGSGSGWPKTRSTAQLDRADAQLKERRAKLDAIYADKRKKLESATDLAPGVLKIVKVYSRSSGACSRATRCRSGTHGGEDKRPMISGRDRLRSDAVRTAERRACRRRAESARRAVADERRSGLETHLGWAAKGLGCRRSTASRPEQRKVARSASSWDDGLQRRPAAARGVGTFTEEADPRARRTLTAGVPVAIRTGVRRCERKAEIKKLLELADLPVTGQAILSARPRTGGPSSSGARVDVGYRCSS